MMIVTHDHLHCHYSLKPPPSSTNKVKKSQPTQEAASEDDECKFIGRPVPPDDAKSKWPHRYQYQSSKQPKGKGLRGKSSINGYKGGDSKEEEEVLQARCHYTQALVDGVVFNLFDDAYISAGDENPHFIAKILEMFETVDGEDYITTQWFFRAEDTVIKKQQAHLIDDRRVFYSDMREDNPLGTIVSKVKIVQLPHNMEQNAEEKALASTDLYFDMSYSLQYYTFSTFDPGNSSTESNGSTISDANLYATTENANSAAEKSSEIDIVQCELTLLDVYSGCGAMSTGLCLGASLGDLTLVTRWAVDIKDHACQSLQLNHPETNVRNEGAEDFLCLLKEWEKLCEEFQLLGSEDVNSVLNCSNGYESDNECGDDGALHTGTTQNNVVCISRFLALQVSWKGYDASYDTWEPIDGLRYLD